MSETQSSASESAAAGVAEHFRSVDSAPKGYAVNRGNSVVNGFLATFTSLSIISVGGFALLHDYVFTHSPPDLLFYMGSGQHRVLPIRIFFALFLITYAIYCFGSPRSKLRVGIAFIVKFAIVCAVVDGMVFLLDRFVGFAIPVFIQQLLAGLGALGVFPHTVLRNARLPEVNTAPIKLSWPIANWFIMAVFGLFAAVFAAFAELRLETGIGFMRDIALLGGIGPGVFLFQQVFAFSLSGIGWIKNAWTRREPFAPPVAIIVPAYNEAHGIAQTIQSVDRAAQTYPGHIRIYIIDNNSRDETAAVARDAIEACEQIDGVVLSCTIPGKAHALNHGLAHITEEFICRIDADTFIADGCLETTMRHFVNPDVGSVGGLALPMPGSGVIGEVRLIEILLRHGFYQVALGAFGGILGIPGMFVVYRRSAMEEAGGITSGMNGEDTDICLRIANLGYKLIADPKAKFYTEVPLNYTHLREQRLRWFRSLYHVVAHNRRILLYPRSITGSIVLPFMLMNAARRAMLLPLLIYSIIVLSVFGNIYVGLRVQAVFAVMLGMPLLMATVVCLLWGRPRTLIFMPLYLAFRLLRGYFTLESVLTLIYDREKPAAEASFPATAATMPRPAPSAAPIAPPEGAVSAPLIPFGANEEAAKIAKTANEETKVAASTAEEAGEGLDASAPDTAAPGDDDEREQRLADLREQTRKRLAG